MELNVVKNFIYFHHIDKACILPCYPQTISESISVTWNATNLLQSSAPIQTWSNSGPRVIPFNFDLHREMLTDTNVTSQTFLGRSLIMEEPENLMEDLISTIKAAALPKYTYVTRIVNPPIVSVSIGNQIYIKGVVNSSVTTDYKGAIRQGKYNEVSLSFSVTEITPYDADSIQKLGNYVGQVYRKVYL